MTHACALKTHFSSLAPRHKEGEKMNVKEKRKEKKSFSAIGKSIRDSIKREGIGATGVKLWINLAVASVGFLFGGCHIAFGTYPLGVAIVSALPSSVWVALVGAILGSLTLGKGGVIYAMICALAVFLRIIISGGAGDREGSSLFEESIPLRASSALIAGFVAGVYEILLGGFRVRAVIFGLAMIAFSSGFTLVFSGAFYHGIGVKSLIFGTRRIFDKTGNAEENRRILIFKISSAVLIMLLSLSLSGYNLFGINLAFVFAGAITLFASKRFGAFYGASVGFISSVAVSGLFSPAYAILGILSGALFVYGTRYATVAGGAGLALWGSYVSGVSGFLGIVPEYLITLCIMMPMLKYFESERSGVSHETVEEKATDMVGTMALAHRNSCESTYERMEKSLSELLPIVSAFLPSESTAEDFAVFLKLVSDMKTSAEDSRELDGELSARLEPVLANIGMGRGMIRAFGKRKKYIVCAGEDRDGTLITSPEFKREIERVTEQSLSAPRYYRRADMAIMECETAKKYLLKFAHITEKGAGGEVSGDSVAFFENEDMFSFGVISDGMGSGSIAKRTSDFTVRFFEASSVGASRDTAVHMINSIIRRQSEECSATLDAFCFDNVSGDAEFIKSGAAVSYIKRNGSLYRIKSETIPLGLMKRVDAERIKVALGEGDTVIMFSDGVCEPAEEAPWLVELLNEASTEDLRALASRILSSAKVNVSKRDDISVLVMRVVLA